MEGDAKKTNEERNRRASIILPINPLKIITTVPGSMCRNTLGIIWFDRAGSETVDASVERFPAESRGLPKVLVTKLSSPVGSRGVYSEELSLWPMSLLLVRLLSVHQIQPEGAGRRGTGRPNPSRETKFSGANGNREMLIFFVQLTHVQGWQPYSVDPFCVTICDDHTYIYTWVGW